MALAQAAFRFGTEGGTESTHGWHAAQNTNVSLAPNKTFLLRFLVQASGGVAHSNVDFQFQYNKNAAGWNNITTSSAVARAVPTVVFAEAANTTNRLTGGTGTFETTSAGCTIDGLSGGTAFDIVSNGYGETECSLILVNADVANNDTIQFRVVGPAGAALTTYPQIPTLTVSKATGVTLNTIGTAQSNTTPSSPSTFTSLINLPNTTGISLVAIAIGGNTSVATCTLGGQTVTEIASQASNNSATAGEIWLGGIFNSVIGSTGNKNLVVTWTGTATSLIAGVSCFDGIHATTPVGTPVTAFGTTAAGIVTVTDSVAGDMVIGAGCRGAAFTAMNNLQHWQVDVDVDSGAGNAGLCSADGGGSVVLGMIAAAEFWGMIGATIKQAAAGQATNSSAIGLSAAKALAASRKNIASAAAGSARFSATVVPFLPPISGSVLLEDGVLELLLENGEPVLFEAEGITVSAAASAQIAQTAVAPSRKNTASAAAGRVAQGATAAPSIKKATVAAAVGSARAWARAPVVRQASATSVGATRATASAPATAQRQSAASGRHAQTAVVIGTLIAGTLLLLENSDDLLLENGDPLLLEIAAGVSTSSAAGGHSQTATAPARKADSSAAIASYELTLVAVPSIKRAASAASGRHAAAAISGVSRKQAAAIVLARAATSAVTGTVTKAVTRTAQGAARAWAQGTASAVQTSSSAAVGRLLATATATDSTGRSALAAGAARSGALATDTTGRATIGSGAARSGALAIDTTGRLTTAAAASTGKAQAGPSLAKHISAASSGQLRAKAAVISTTTRITALARGSARSSIEQPIFLGARATLHLSAVAANIAVARRASAIAAAPTTSVATDTTRRSSATAVGAAASRATAPQASTRRSAAVGSVRSGAAVASSSSRAALAKGAAKTSAAQPTFLSIKASLRQSATATNLTTSRQAAGVAATKIVATALDTTARASQVSGAATTKAIAAQGNSRQSVVVGQVRGTAAVICTPLRITALAKGAAKTNAVQPKFPSVKSAGKQSAVAAGTAQRIAIATAAQASRAIVASGQATRTAPTLYVIAGTDVVATPGPSHRATAVARGSATTGGSISSGAAARRSTVAAATLRFSVIGIQIPPEVIWLRGRRDTTQLRGKYGNDNLRGRRDSTQLRGKYGNGSLHGQSAVIALRGRR